jgi:GTP cyclohydrolase I
VYADERIQKQNSVTTTSSFTGAFEEDKTKEFISLISINLVKFSTQKNL